MAKFSTRRADVLAPIRSAGEDVTHEGGHGYVRDAKSELFLLAVTNMVSEGAFYESGKARDDRFGQLIHQVTREDPAWIRSFVPFLRNEMNMRSASIIMAAEYVKAGGPNGRRLVDFACQRADEPGEMLAYWMSEHGRNIPQPVKRGVADAARRLYNERSVLKWDGSNRPWRFGDVIDLAHPKPTAKWQSDLFRLTLDRRHNRERIEIPETLRMLVANDEVQGVPIAGRREYMKLNPEMLQNAGMTWETLSAWLGGPMDAEAWEAIIPSMGYMALLRNLRNFDQAGISDDAAAYVMGKLSDSAGVAKSRQFPIRFFSAWKAVQSLRWGSALEVALGYSLANIPTLPGRTLILVDCSGSMYSPMSNRSEVLRSEVAGVFGVAMALRAEKSTLVRFGSESQECRVSTGASVLRAATDLTRESMGGTDTWPAVAKHYKGHDRILIVTDEQSFYDPMGYEPQVKVPLYTWNIAGYRVGHAPSGGKNRYVFGGLTDAAFRMVPLVEANRDARWPWAAI